MPNISPILRRYQDLFLEKHGVPASLNYKICGSVIKRLKKDHSEKGIIRIIELYFEDPSNNIFHFPTIFSSYSMNKYLPKIKYNPMIYSDAEELNKEIY